MMLIGHVLIKYVPEFTCWKDVEHENFAETKEISELVSVWMYYDAYSMHEDLLHA